MYRVLFSYTNDNILSDYAPQIEACIYKHLEKTGDILYDNLYVSSNHNWPYKIYNASFNSRDVICNPYDYNLLKRHQFLNNYDIIDVTKFNYIYNNYSFGKGYNIQIFIPYYDLYDNNSKYNSINGYNFTQN